jgi:3-oxoacyl-[acyl-carrier protein] reductase
MDLGLTGKRALVTAGSKGIGRAIALGLAREGAKVSICARGQSDLDHTRAELRELQPEAMAVAADVSKMADVSRVVEQTVDAFGGLDILIVNAGGPPAQRFEDSDDGAWQAAFELTLLSAVRLIRLALPHLEASRGSVVTIQSISVKQPVTGLLLSNAMRPAVIGMIKTLADEIGPKGVRLNNVLPGMILTDRSRKLAESRAASSNTTADEIIASTASTIPLGRYGDPEELANLAVFLASERASYLTGLSVLCDGGLYRGLL